MWYRPGQIQLRERQLYIVVLNDKILGDILMYDASEKKLYSSQHVRGSGALDISPSECQAIAEWGIIPRPEWLSEDMAARDNEHGECLRLADAYRKKNGDLFGSVVDPDDIDRSFDVVT